MKKDYQTLLFVAGMVALIYLALYYTGNFNVSTFLQGFGENLAAFIIVAVAAILIVKWGRR